MTEEYEERLRDSFMMAILRAIEIGWLAPVELGFCFYCNEEKPVLEVTAENAPAQPPRCMQCFIDMAAEMFEDLAWQNFVDGHK